MKKENVRSKSPWFQERHVENSEPANASVRRKKKERGVPTAVEVYVEIEFLPFKTNLE